MGQLDRETDRGSPGIVRSSVRGFHQTGAAPCYDSESFCRQPFAQLAGRDIGGVGLW